MKYPVTHAVVSVGKNPSIRRFFSEKKASSYLRKRINLGYHCFLVDLTKKTNEEGESNDNQTADTDT